MRKIFTCLSTFTLLIIILSTGCANTKNLSSSNTVALTKTKPFSSPTRTSEPTLPPTATSSPTPGGPRYIPISVSNASQAEEVLFYTYRYILEELTPVQIRFSQDDEYFTILYADFSGDDIPTSIIVIGNARSGEIISQEKALWPAVIQADGTHVAVYENGIIRFIDLSSDLPDEEMAIGKPPSIYDIRFSPDGNRLAIKNNGIVIWDLLSHENITTLDFDKYIHQIIFSHDAGTLAILSFNHIYVYDINTGGLLWEYNDDDWDFHPQELALSGNGAYLAVLGERKLGNDKYVSDLELWDVRSEKKITSWNDGVSRGSFSDIVFSNDGKLLAFNISTGSKETQFDDKILVFRVESGALMRTVEGRAGLAFSPDNKILTAALRTGPIQLWNIDNGRLLTVLTGHGPQIENVIFSSSSALLASIGFDKIVRIWGIPSEGVIIKRFGFSISETGSGGSASRLIDSVPAKIIAKGPAPARYQLRLLTGFEKMKSCAYTGNHHLSLTRQNVTVSIIDNLSRQVIAENTFLGEPDSLDCPYEWEFISPESAFMVGSPNVEEFKAWLLEEIASLEDITP
jgi:WD40 repeat protein